MTQATDLYDSIWERVPVHATPERFELRRRFLTARVEPGEIVLDLGCGAGEFAAALHELGATAIGVDVSGEALRRARERAPDVELRHWPAGVLPAQDATIDVVWAGEVIEHVADLAPWLSEVRRVLRPGGRLLLTTPHHGPVRMLGLAVSRRRFAEHFEPLADHVRFFSPRTLRALLDGFGFHVVELRSAGGPPLLRATILVRAVRP